MICLASQSSHDKGDPYDYFRLNFDRLNFDRLQVCSRSVLLPSVLWIALKTSSCTHKGNLLKIVWSSTFYVSAPNRLFELCSFAGGSQKCCFLHELVVEISCCPQKVNVPISCLLVSSRFAIRTRGLNYDHLQGVERSLWVATCNFLIAATRLA